MKARFLAVTLSILALGLLDVVIKVYAINNFPEEQAATLQPVLSLALHRNPGIAFDIPIPLSLVIPLTLVVCAGLGWLIYTKRYSKPEQALSGLAALIGALGNAGDRVIHGFTTDYLILFKTSAINLSDVLIVLGILGVIWYDKYTPRPEADVPLASR